jgi:hypothetical protein
MNANPPYPFVQPSHHADILTPLGERVGTMSLAGPILEIELDQNHPLPTNPTQTLPTPLPSSPAGRNNRPRTAFFEMHGYFGPIPVSKRTGDPLSRIPAGFWEAFGAWCNSGQLVVKPAVEEGEWWSKFRKNDGYRGMTPDFVCVIGDGCESRPEIKVTKSDREITVWI